MTDSAGRIGRPVGGSRLFGGALVLVAGSVASRILGASYRIVLPILMGGGQQAALGMGLFQLAYPVFTVLVTLITTGLPMAVSKLMSQRLAVADTTGARALLRAAAAGLPLCGAVFALLLWLAAPLVATRLIGDPRAILSMRAIAPAILTVSLASAYRGGFLGRQDMFPYAVSQVVEQIARVLTMFALVVLLLPRGVAAAAAGASFGAVIGGIGATVTCLMLWRRRAGIPLLPAAARVQPAMRTRSGPPVRLFWELLLLAVPIAATATVLPLLNLTDAALVPLRLRAAGLGSDAVALYGVLTGYAAPLVLAPTIFTSALAMSILPAISSALASGSATAGRASAAAGLRLTVLVALPAAAGLALVAGVLPEFLFHSTLASRPLVAMAPALVFLGLQQTSSGILQGRGRPDLPLRHLATAAAIKVACDWVLVARPEWNITGAAIGTTGTFALACVLNLRAVARQLPGSVNPARLAAGPLAATAIMAVGVIALRRLAWTHLGPEVVALCLAGAVLYGLAVLLVGGVRRAEVELIPRLGPALANALVRLHLLRP